MPEVMTIGSALVDIFVHSQSFQLQQTDQGLVLCQKYGDKVEVDSFQAFGGGGASNTAAGFRRMSFATGIVAELGKDTLANVVVSELQAEQIETQWLISEKKEQTGGSVILVGPDGGRTVMVHRGAASQLDQADLPMAELQQTQWIHLSSVGGRLEVLQSLFDLAAQNQRKISWNPGKSELQLLVDGQIQAVPVQILLVNAEEWEMVNNKQGWLLQQVPIIVITQGKEGGRILTQSQELFYHSPIVTSVDDTGAGDAFAVGFVSAHITGKDPHEAARWGSINAASVVQQIGAKPGLLQRSELERILMQEN